jgi:integrase
MARGSILRRRNKDGTTTFSIKYRIPDGTQIKRAAGRTRAEAEQALTAALAAIDKGAVRTAGKETFAEAADRWLRSKRPHLEASTFQDYERHLRFRLLPAFGDAKLRSITRSKVEDYVASLDGPSGLSRKTINDSLIPLRQILGRAVREGVLPTNPAESPDRDSPIELPYERPSIKPLTRDEARRYLDACLPHYRALAEVLLGAGLRIGEALALEWDDIGWDTSTLSVTKTFKVGGIGTPKGDRGRGVVVAAYVLEVLRHHRAESGRLSGLIFCRPDGTPIRRQAVHRFWHRAALTHAGLPLTVRLHDLRHTAATLWLASGQSIYFVQQQLGHRDIQTTIDLYGHPDQEAHRQAAEEAAAWWREGTSEGSRVPPAVPRQMRERRRRGVEPVVTGTDTLGGAAG